MKLAFCGTPHFAVPTLEALIAAGHDIALVLTQPDRPSGRGMTASSSAVKRAAQSHNLRVLQPEKIRSNEELRLELERLRPHAIIVVAYGRIIPPWMLKLPRYGNINLHGSLLPKYRGAAPIQWAIAAGETETGVTTMLLDEGLDTGDLLLAHKVAILPDATAPELFETLAEIGAPLMVETLRKLELGTLPRVRQDETAASHAPVLTREDGWLDFQRTAQQTYNRWRGFLPWPGTHTRFRGKRLSVQQLCPAQGKQLPSGELEWSGGQLFAGTGAGTSLELKRIQVEGKGPVSAAEFVRGYQVRSGERLGP